MRFSIDPSVLALYPHLRIGILHCSNIDNTKSNPAISELLRSTEAALRALPDAEAVNDHPKIAALREAHRLFGSSPKKYAPSAQALVRRVVKGGELPSINPLVDLYNIISLQYILPAGGEDLDACEGDILLTRADGTETFIELGGTENEPPEPGEVVYKDASGVLCRKFNWREAERTKLTGQTRNAVLVIEALPPVTSEELHSATQELAQLVRQFCAGTCHLYTLDVDSPSCELLLPTP